MATTISVLDSTGTPVIIATNDALAALLGATNTALGSVVDATSGTETSLGQILAKLIAAPATEAKQDAGNTVLGQINGKLIAAPATEAKQDAGNTVLGNMLNALSEILDGVTGPVQMGISASTTPAAITQGQRDVAAAGTPVRLVAAATLVESVEMFARKAPGTANTGNVYVGSNAAGGQNFRVLAPGESLTLSAPAGKKLDLNAIFIDAATNADAVSFIALN